MQNKFNMSVSDNIECAKRLEIDNIYKSANLEGITITFADTVNILNNVNAPNLKPLEINKVCCLRDGWKFLLDNISKPLDLAFLEELHVLVARFDVPYYRLGVLRDDLVAVSGTNWKPEVHDANFHHNNIQKILSIENPTDKALSMCFYLMRSQLFFDGNKRISSFACNKILIENGCGTFGIPIEEDGHFKQELINFYETNNDERIKKLSWNVGIKGDGKEYPTYENGINLQDFLPDDNVLEKSLDDDLER